MAELVFTARGRSAEDAAMPRITSLITDLEPGLLHSITVDGARVESWDITARGVDVRHWIELDSASWAGAVRDLAGLDLVSGPALLATGPGAARLHLISDAGGIGAGRTLSVPA